MAQLVDCCVATAFWSFVRRSSEIVPPIKATQIRSKAKATLCCGQSAVVKSARKGCECERCCTLLLGLGLYVVGVVVGIVVVVVLAIELSSALSKRAM